MARLSANVAGYTGLDHEVVARVAGRVDIKTFSRERLKSSGRVLSAYDGEITGFDPTPFARDSDWAIPYSTLFRAPLGAAMTSIVTEKLQWPVGDARYEILNNQLAHQWDFERGGRHNAEALSDLRQELALDPRLKVLVVHGLADLVTPYFATKLMLDQLPAYGMPKECGSSFFQAAICPHTGRLAQDAARCSENIHRRKMSVDFESFPKQAAA